MGYSKSRVTLNRRMKEYQTFFDTLAAGRPARLVGSPNTAHHLSYKVREALHVASIFPQFYPQLASASARFAIEILDDHTIQARVKQGSTEVAVAVGSETPTQVPEASGGVGTPQVVVGLKTATDIISYCIRRLPTNDPIHFPDASISDDELAKVWKWCRSLTPKRVIVKPKGTNAITIMNKPGKGHPVSTAIWSPPNTPAEEESGTSVDKSGA